MRLPKGVHGLARVATAKGFTLIEILIVSAIIATLSVVFILNFRLSAKNKTARLQVASIIVSDLRQAESMSISGSRYQGNIACGFGVHYVDSATYLIYAKSVPMDQPCASLATRNYTDGDPIVAAKKVFNPGVEIRSHFNDIFFEPPDPKIYIDNDSSLTHAPEQIIIQLLGQADCVSQPCTTIQVYTSGELDIN